MADLRNSGRTWAGMIEKATGYFSSIFPKKDGIGLE
jgi:hypothetical protein